MMHPYLMIAILDIGLLAGAHCINAHAAVHPSSEPIVIRPEKAADAQKPFCLQATTQYRVLVYPDGRKEVTGYPTIWTVCEKAN